jgi:hypothetical protein
MVGLMIQRVNMQYVALVFFFTLCQVIGTMCTLPELSMAADTALLVEEGMACPMDGTTMCPPSLTSSPERRIKHPFGANVDHATTLLSLSTALPSPSVPAPWSWRSVLSLVPISIGYSSVLRIWSHTPVLSLAIWLLGLNGRRPPFFLQRTLEVQS